VTRRQPHTLDVVLAATYADGLAWLAERPELGRLDVVTCGQRREAVDGRRVGVVHVTPAAARHPAVRDLVCVLRHNQRRTRAEHETRARRTT
jgi:hypothetical protein